MATQKTNAFDDPVAIREHIIDRVCDISIYKTPYPHAIIDNFFPDDIVRKIDNFFPCVAQSVFDSVDETKEQKRYRRSFFGNDTDKTSLERTLDEVYNVELLKFFLEKFDIQYNTNYAWGIQYVWDYSVRGHNALPPHVDQPSKVLSFVHYFPITCIENGKPKVLEIPGTDILVQNTDGTFAEHTCVEAKRNRCLIFEKSTKSWHAVKETKTPRRTITAFIIDKRVTGGKNGSFLYLK
jgi:hypothetical protein